MQHYLPKHDPFIGPPNCNFWQDTAIKLSSNAALGCKILHEGFGRACLNIPAYAWYICISNYCNANTIICKNYVDSNESSIIINGQNDWKFLDSCNFWQFNSLIGKKRCAREQKNYQRRGRHEHHDLIDRMMGKWEQYYQVLRLMISNT